MAAIGAEAIHKALGGSTLSVPPGMERTDSKLFSPEGTMVMPPGLS